jgi:hypothetical protein
MLSISYKAHEMFTMPNKTRIQHLMSRLRGKVNSFRFSGRRLGQSANEYIRTYFKTDIEPVIKEAREKWKCLKSR